MCIVAPAPTPGLATPAAPACPAHRLGPPQRQALALAALTAARPLTHLAAAYRVSRKFVYQQRDRAERALTQAFAPAPPEPDRVLFWLPVTDRWLRRLILALLLVCHSSYRGVSELLRDLFHVRLALGTIHALARAAMDRAAARNRQHDLSAVAVGAHDEIFQGPQPVLVGVDVASSYCYLLSPEEHRDGETWGVRLLELQGQGFAPAAIVSDGGSGLQAGHALALPQVPHRGDVFHVVQEATTVVRSLEHRAYHALAACAQLEHQQAQSQRRQGRCDRGAGQRLRHARPAAEAAVALADEVATLVGWLRHDILAVAGPCHAERRALYDFVIAELRARVPAGPHCLGRLCTYLADRRDAVLAFARQLDAALEALAADFQVPPAVVRAVLQVQALAVHDRRRWPREAALRQQLRGRFYALSRAVAALARGTVRASAVVENLNSRLRSYFFLRRQLGRGYLQLLRFFLNHRRFLRSAHPERVGRSPAELLTGQGHAHWLELLGLPDPLRN
jgi:hypothetical protein